MSRSVSDSKKNIDSDIICIEKSLVSGILIWCTIVGLITMTIYFWWSFYENEYFVNYGTVSEVLFFKREGCVHCERMRGEWDKFKNHNYLKRNNIIIKEYDGLIEDDRKVMEQYNITGVPTIIFKMQNGYHVYNGARKANLIVDQLKNICSERN